MTSGAAACPRRVRVLGVSGAGTTTFGRALAARLGVPFLEVDAVLHRAGWATATWEEYRDALTAFRRSPDAADGWVVDGPYPTPQDAADDAADGCDTVVWLDPPRAVALVRLLRRTLGRVLLRRRLWNGNVESWSRVLSRDPQRNVLLWAWTQHAHQRASWEALSRAAAATGRPRWVRLRSRREARRWLTQP